MHSARKQTTVYSSPECELSVLACILLDADYSFDLLSKEEIHGAHFFDLWLRELFMLLSKMHTNGETINNATFFQRAKEADLMKTSEQLWLLGGLADETPSAHGLSSFIPELKEKHQRRLVLDVSRRLEKLAVDGSAPPGPLLEDAEHAVKYLRRTANPQTFTVRSAGQLIEQSFLENDNILGDRLLAKGQPMTILGAGGLGKSRLLLQLAACCITGRPFLDLRTHAPGLRWLILQTENSNRRLQQDLQALRTWLGDAWDEVTSRLFIHTLESCTDSFVQLNSAGHCQRLADVIEAYEADVVCFDPLNCFSSGDLNNDGEMRATCQAITALAQGTRADRAVVVLHHALTGRMGAARATGFERSSFGRNSKLLHAWTRGQINVAPADPNDNNRLVISCGKCSNGEEFDCFGVRLNRETMIYEPDREFNLAAWEKKVTAPAPPPEPVDLLMTICAEARPRHNAVQKLIQQGVSRSRAYRAVEEAMERRWIILREDGCLHLSEPAGLVPSEAP
jgi:hypothetical protein